MEDRKMKVSLLNWKVGDPIKAISHAALSCYQEQMPEWGKKIDVEKSTFKTGHHTTIQHVDFTFFIEGVSVGDVTFGLHLANPFYDTSQRSGRFCAKMFSLPDYRGMSDYIRTFWRTDFPKENEIMRYIKEGVDFYTDNIQAATVKADEFIREERPKASEEYRRQNAPKIAQEQLRVFVPVIFPTALEYTINLSTLAAMYQSAWSPVMYEITRQMSALVINKWPEVSFMFTRRKSTGSSVLTSPGKSRIFRKPRLTLLSKGEDKLFVKPDACDLHPVDLLHFLPKYMANNVEEVKTLVEISVATMGQDQRHRTIRRGQPSWTGNFYLPPIPDSLGMEEKATSLMRQWREISQTLPESLVTILAPYGAMVRYKKSASYNAATHELGKRLCWCAQEEIYHLARSLKRQLGSKSPLHGMFTVPCVVSGKCGEGNRCCGRDMKRREEVPFPERRV